MDFEAGYSESAPVGNSALGGMMWPVPISPSAAHFNREQATSARQANELAYSRRYQVTTADLMAAGLNPMLAATGGNVSGVQGAPAGSVSSGSGSFTRQPLVDQQAELMNEQTNAAIAAAQASRASAQRDYTQADINVQEELGRRAELPARAATARAIAEAQKTEEKVEKSFYGAGLRWLGRMNPFGHAAGAAARVFK